MIKIECKIKIDTLKKEQVSQHLLLEQLLRRDEEDGDFNLPGDLALPLCTTTEVDKLADMLGDADIKGKFVE